jgi:hypothetical protein
MGRSPDLKNFRYSQESKLKVSSQWRDRTGFSPVSLFSPYSGAPRCFQIQRTISSCADVITRSFAVSNHRSPGSALIWTAVTCHAFAAVTLHSTARNEHFHQFAATGRNDQRADMSTHSKLRHYRLQSLELLLLQRRFASAIRLQ